MAKQVQQRRRGQPKGAALAPLWGSILLALLLILSLPTVVLMFFGMLPTLVAFIVDRTEQKYAATSVGGLNFSGVFPFLLDLWFGDHSFKGAIHSLTDVYALLLMYASAAFGWMLYSAVPPIVTAFLTVVSQRRVALLRTNQRKLIEEWGEDVAHLAQTTAKGGKGGDGRVEAHELGSQVEDEPRLT